MPLNVRRFCTSIALALSGFFAIANAQTAPPASEVLAKAPTSSEVMRDRISKAKAYIAVRNYSAAIFELENIRRETNDSSVHAVTNVLLMNSYLEKGDYTRAQELLNEFHGAQKTNKPHSTEFYAAVAGQIVKGARQQVERYRGLGLTVSDRNLPLQAVNDIEQMRETLELVVTQTKETSKDKAKAAFAVPLLEEAATTRSILARDDYDARRWREELGDSRELMAQSRSVVINAVDGTTYASAPTQQPAVQNAAPATPVSAAAANTPASVPAYRPSAPNSQPVAANTQAAPTQQLAAQPQRQTPASRSAEQTPRERLVPNAPVENAVPKNDVPIVPVADPKPAGPVDVGSLIAYATQRAAPAYPATARNMRTTGTVRVEITVNEDGGVAAIEKASGPVLLQNAAQDAVKKWKFKPFVRDGQPVKAKGFVNFNFTL